MRLNAWGFRVEQLNFWLLGFFSCGIVAFLVTQCIDRALVIGNFGLCALTNTGPQESPALHLRGWRKLPKLPGEIKIIGVWCASKGAVKNGDYRTM